MTSIRMTARAVVVLWLILAPALAVAQPAPVDEFRPMSPEELAAGQEQVPAAGLVFTAYAIVWLVFGFYAVTLWKRVAKVEGELTELTNRLERPVR